MSHNTLIKEQAVTLRKSGKTYSEILRVVPVAKSTLSEWLKSVGLSKTQKQTITQKKLEGARRGAERRHLQRLEKVAAIYTEAEKELDHISDRELWLMGIALYWAEGSKEKEYRPGSGIIFTNSDAKMITFFLNWLQKIMHISRERIYFEIYIHDSCADRITDVVKYWARITRFSEGMFTRIYFKKNKINTKRRNVGDLYYGVLRVKVLSSSDLNRKIAGIVNGVCEVCKK